MKFGIIPVKDALGHINAHSVAVSGGKISKGAVVSKADIDQMQAAGVTQITVAQLAPDDLHEDAAAKVLADALVPDPAAVNLRLTAAKTGRVNVYADAEGVVCFDADAIHRFNAINPMITVATVDPLHRLGAGGMVATVKVISYGVPKDDVAAACDTQAQISLATCRYQTVTLIETQHGAGLPNDKGRRALLKRVGPFGIRLTDRVCVAHEVKALAAAIKGAPGDVVCILTASATSDAHDVAPSALRHAGGVVERFGMPVDPGNLLFLGQIGAKPVIGLPGCARSPALNGADWVLNRVLCGVPLGSADIAAMGVGGLLKEIPTRPRPRDG